MSDTTARLHQPPKGAEVTIKQLPDGPAKTVTLHNNWLIITEGRSFVANEVEHANGTVVLTIKSEKLP